MSTIDDKAYQSALDAVKMEIDRQAEANSEYGNPAEELERAESRQRHEAELDRLMTRRQVMDFVKRLEAGELSEAEELAHYGRQDSDGDYGELIEDAGAESRGGWDDGFAADELAGAAEVLESAESTDEERAAAESVLLGEELDDVPAVEMASDLTKTQFADMIEGATRRGQIPESPYGPPEDPNAAAKAARAVEREQRLQSAIAQVHAESPEVGGLVGDGLDLNDGRTDLDITNPDLAGGLPD